jgi:RNA polymerase sigma factor (sigma-70 family)
METTMAARLKSMPTSPLNRVIQHVLADVGPDGAGMTDGELVARFLSSRDDNALAALVRRHAPMVWGVCCRLLHNHDDAEDAFQATFLVLVRKAADVPRQAVATWLYGVARQTAVRLRALAAKRGRREKQVVNMPEPTLAEGQDADLQSVLDEELGRLPGHYRGVIVLCDLEGMTRKEAARQLGIPEGSVASRLARARALLAKRLTLRGVVFSGGSVAAVLSAGSASASAPPDLVASTIKAASMVAVGTAAATGVISAKVAALTDGMVKAMFVTKIKSVLAVVLVIGAVAGGAGIYYQASAAQQPTAKAEPPAAKKDPNMSHEKQIRANPPAQPKRQPAKTDLERIIGRWVIVSGDNVNTEGSFWEIGNHQIVMNAQIIGGLRVVCHFHRLDAAKNPKQIDITVTSTGGVIGGPVPRGENHRTVGVIKGIYELARGELRLCLGEMGKDRPAAFPDKPGPGEVLILHRSLPTDPKNAKAERKVLTPEEAIKQMSKENVTVQFKITSVEAMPIPLTGFGGPLYYNYRIFLHDGDKFTTRLAHAADQIMKRGIEPVKHFNGKVVRVTGRVESEPGNRTFQMWVRDETHIEVVKEKTETDGKKQKPSEDKQPRAKAEKLRVLIDKVLAAHGGEDKLNKLTSFTMTVKHSNLETQRYFVQLPKNFRWETTHPDRTNKRIVILFPEGRRWWTKEPNGEAVEFRPTGAERTMEYWLDYVKFFGPRQVLRLKDADHRATLLDDEVKIGDRPAVGVEVTGPQFKRKMYFDKETHLLQRSGAVTYSDYKPFDGLAVAQKENDGYLLPQVTDFRAVEKFDAKLFEQP